MPDPKEELDALWAQLAALTARVYRLEQASGVAAEAPAQAASERMPAVAAPPLPAGRAVPPPQRPVGVGAVPLTATASPGPPFVRTAVSRPERADLEKTIGQYWLNRIGIVAMLVGVSYFLKYAFENDWIGPAGRIAIGLLAGTALVIWSERFRIHGHGRFSYSLKAIGIGTIYLSLWAAFQLYALIPAAVAFAAMALVTAATIALALTQDTELLAAFALAGGFATPVLLSTGQNREVVLFSYVALLDLAVLAMVMFKPWRRLLWGSFAGTIALYAGWSGQFYTQGQRPVTVLFVVLFAAIFAASVLLTPYERSTRFAGPSVTLTILPLLNAGACFLALYAMYDREMATLTWYALGLAATYLGISSLFQRRFPGQDTALLNMLHVAIAIGFITIAIPLKLERQWITIGWLVESAVLLWLGVRMRVGFLRYLAVSALALGIIRLLVHDRFQTDRLVFNARFATYAVAVAVLAGIVYAGRRNTSEADAPWLRLALLALNLLALIALTWEASDYFARQLTAARRNNFGGAGFVQLRVARDFSYSAIWLCYGAALMAIGFWRKIAFVRWQSLALIAATIVKVFLYDVSALQTGYRILSFIALGAVLLAMSFIYQRDWLKLSSRPSGERSAGTP